MKERPILFSTPMVRAILEGRKSQTRRIMKPQPKEHNHLEYIEADWRNEKPEYVTTENINAWFCKYCGEGICNATGNPFYKCPYGWVGDILYVKETYTIFEPEHCEGMSERFYYKADHHPLNEEWRQEMISHGYPYKWKSGRFMRKSASRIKLKVTNVRVERVQEITEEDAIAEGIKKIDGEVFGYPFGKPKDAYRVLWLLINGKGSWEKNPWVWVIEFERIK